MEKAYMWMQRKVRDYVREKGSNSKWQKNQMSVALSIGKGYEGGKEANLSKKLKQTREHIWWLTINKNEDLYLKLLGIFQKSKYENKVSTNKAFRILVDASSRNLEESRNLLQSCRKATCGPSEWQSQLASWSTARSTASSHKWANLGYLVGSSP